MVFFVPVPSFWPFKKLTNDMPKKKVRDDDVEARKNAVEQIIQNHACFSLTRPLMVTSFDKMNLFSNITRQPKNHSENQKPIYFSDCMNCKRAVGA